MLIHCRIIKIETNYTLKTGLKKYTSVNVSIKNMNVDYKR